MVVSSDPALAQQDEALRWDELQPPPPLWSMVTVRDCHKLFISNRPTIFPPVNHENLSVSSVLPHFRKPTALHDNLDNPHLDLELSSSSSSDSDSDSDSTSITNSNSSSAFSLSNNSPIVRFQEVPRVIGCDSWMDSLRLKANGIIRSIIYYYSSSRKIFSNSRSFAITVVLIAFLYFRQRRRLKIEAGSRARLVGIIKERDERIGLLLDQISRMNQVLLAPNRASTS